MKRPVKKPHSKDHVAEREAKAKSLATYLDQKLAQLNESKAETFAQADLVCPHCGWHHDPEDFYLGKRSEGSLKCSDCGEEFQFEAVTQVVYTTSVP